MGTKKRKNKKANKKRKLVFNIIGSVLALLLVLTGMLVLMVFGNVFGRLPDKSELEQLGNEEASLVYSADNKLIGKYFAENRTNISWDDVPVHLREALIATEDRRFYDHRGYDTRSYLRVFLKTILLGDRSSGGGSTITQQLVKNMYGRKKYAVLGLAINKMKEVIIAARIEEVYTKDEILLLYLNSVPFGEDVYGVESAAHRYFNKPVRKLHLHESAVLVGMLKANTLYNPQMNPEASKARRNTVLSLMEGAEYISAEEAGKAQDRPLGTDYNNLNKNSPAGYFVYRVRQRVEDILDETEAENGSSYDLEKDGLRIHTTLNMGMQQAAISTAERHLEAMQKLLDSEMEQSGNKEQWYAQQRSVMNGTDTLVSRVQVYDHGGIVMRNLSRIDSLWHYYRMLNAAVLVTDPRDGSVLTWVGGNNYRLLPFDMVLSHRQSASAFKPFLYATAMEEGAGPCTYLENEERDYPGYDDWHPQNADRHSTADSTVAMWYALAHSLNLPTVNLWFMTGGSKLVNTCNSLGMPVPGSDEPSSALGSLDLSLYEMVRAYGAIANSGRMHEPVMINRISDPAGNIIYSREDYRPREVFDRETTDQLTAMLQQVVEQGTATGLRSRYGVKAEIAGKTGTAGDYSDAWFVAYTPNIVAGTWVGAAMPEVHFRSANGSGSALAMPVTAGVITYVERDRQLSSEYLVPFDLPGHNYDFLDCDPWYREGVRGFFERLFSESGEKKDSLSTEDKSTGLRSLIRKIFRK
ncbi:MAG: transglycosylase domain-containing protein [Bacteroidales bacterium]|nr:transglycosylase domain-containing protein [Bacteroidales bacterium]